MDEFSGEREAGEAGVGEAHAHISTGPGPSRADELIDRASTLGRGASGRMGEFASEAGRRAGAVLEDAERTLEERTHLVSMTRQYPLAALGIAFAAGYVLAGRGDREGARSRTAKVANQMKGAVVGALSAAISNEIRSFVEEQGGAGGLATRLRSLFEDPDDLDVGPMAGGPDGY
ncbi:MAG TPA: hypothetical protein VFI91_07525 [Longimicrobiaceae bacterium]|nr:hypothetical protein [Longimicrobiaceae bacterium]